MVTQMILVKTQWISKQKWRQRHGYLKGNCKQELTKGEGKLESGTLQYEK